PCHPTPPLFPYTTLFRSFTARWVTASKEACYETVIQRTLPRSSYVALSACFDDALIQQRVVIERLVEADPEAMGNAYDAIYEVEDRKSTRLNSSHVKISY